MLKKILKQMHLNQVQQVERIKELQKFSQKIKYVKC